jgi:fucose 4-O-acetylase-like acetyltransferase
MKTAATPRARIPWVDTLRFLGIYFIYLGHFGQSVPRIYPITYIFTVPLFFGLSGSMEALSSKTRFWPILYKKIRTILLPYFFFSAISLTLATILYEISFPGMISTLREIFIGLRNTLFASSLWFLPCLFLTELIFMLLRLVIKPAWALFLATSLIFILAHAFMPHNPLNTPRWFWNLDTALYYLFYYGLGYWGFPYLVRLLGDGSRRPPFWFILGGALSAAYSLALIFQKDFLADALAFLSHLRFINNLVPVGNALIMLWAFLLAALVLQPFKLLQKIGRETLYLCGNEYIVKLLITHTLGLIGLSIAPQNPLAAYIYSFILLLLAVYILIPFERRLYQRLLEFFALEAVPKPAP